MSQTIPSQAMSSKIAFVIPPGAVVTQTTGNPSFDDVKERLAAKGPRRPARLHPARSLTNAELQKIAASNPPPAEWFEGEDDCPFAAE